MIEGKHPAFRVVEENPPNGGAAIESLVEHTITPVDRFFLRSHSPTPHVDPASYWLTIEGAVKHPLSLTLEDLSAFPRVSLTAALQCAGNRRVEMQQIAPIPDELIWDREAISNGVWSGYSLAAILRAAGINESAADRLHVAFEALDQCERQNTYFPYGSSIPLAKALDPLVMLADTLNDAPLTPDHGYPLRVFVPGYIGARSVKWVGRIIVQDEPSENYYQARAYKLFPPNIQPEDADWEQGLMLGELSINSAIAAPQDRDIVPPGEVVISGYAISGGRGVARVDVSTDAGITWKQAALLGDDLPYAWRLWEYRTELHEGDYHIIARAWDSAANTQPEQIIWNFKGYMNNTCPRIRLQVKG